ncbi:N-acyl-D-amino-acid deacylase family protein [Steroidobacter sp.]|uniref:N-acyl-D-amino-acid deacylase family protein n=1 Tax=Steroidobacter sp. TaxID=1978227 RepID=UPI001A5E4E30|nr:D-aminoacylase [Steroidobacter sp.]MBL8264848.1 D-aminoacylase [Steroidobacter sp.]
MKKLKRLVRLGFAARAAAMVVGLLAGASTAVAAAAPESLLIQNVLIVDGSGAAPYSGALRIAGGRIVELGKDLKAKPGEKTHDGNGQVLAPGFIDTHSHHERGLFKKPTGDELLSQGVTTIVIGQDGGSMYPIGKLWKTIGSRPVAVNVASYSGHNTIRSQVLGKNYKRVSTPQEVAAMVKLVDADMRDGSIGLSSGLGYDPGIYADISEVVELGKATAPYGGRYISHIRSENVKLWESIDELLQVGREARIPVQLSHAKLSMVSLWGQAPKLLKKLDAARAQGIDATLDIYPYEYWQSTMTVALPERDFNDVAAARFVLANTIKPEGIRFTTYDADPSIVGKTLAQVAAERKADPAELYLKLIRDSIAKDADETIIGTSMSSEDIATMMRWSHANICSDGETAGSHPRGAGSYARILRKYVREDGVLSLQSAVQKMSGLAADHMGFKDRGYLRPGLVADLVVFDPAKVQDHATVETPARLATGISAVWVNGEQVWNSGKATGKFPGKPLRRATGE